MSDDGQYLLTRRQVLAVFGVGLGSAIVAEGSTDLDGDGDNGGASVYGGVSKLAQLYKIGEGTWKGPLSVRSSVPQEDGNDFIQTDAGSNNNKYQFWHYSGGWSAQGWDVPEITIDDLNATEQEGVSQSVWAALSNGFVVGYAPDAHPNALKILKPSTATNDATALQNVVDWIVGQTNRFGELHIPAVKDNGNRWFIDNGPVTIGSTNNFTPINTYGHGFVGGAINQIGTTVDTGTFLFEIVGGTTDLRGVNFHNITFNLNGHDMSILRADDCFGLDIRIPWARSFTGTGIKTEHCFETTINAVLDPNDGAGTPTAVPLEIAGGFDGYVQNLTVPTGGCKHNIHISGAVEDPSTVTLGNVRVEGANEEAILAEAGVLFASPMTKTTDGSVGIKVDGADGAFLYPGSIFGTSSHAIHVASAPTRLHIWPHFRTGSIGGDDVHVDAAATNQNLVPDAELLNGTVTYPSSINKLLEPSLKTAGYAGGDAIQSVTLAGGAAAENTSSSTYGDVHTSQIAPNIFWDSIRGNSSVTMQAYMAIDVDPNNDQIDVRLQNTTDGETIIEQTGTTGGSRVVLEIGPTDYTPTTTGSKIEVRLQARNSDNSTTVTTRDPLIQISPKV